MEPEKANPNRQARTRQRRFCLLYGPGSHFDSQNGDAVLLAQGPTRLSSSQADLVEGHFVRQNLQARCLVVLAFLFLK